MVLIFMNLFLILQLLFGQIDSEFAELQAANCISGELKEKLH